MIEKLETRLEDAFDKLDLPPRGIDRFKEYLLLLEKWNKNINLISRKENDIIDKLLAPSLLFFKLIDNIPGKSVVDLGSGAGFPAFVIKIYNPDIDITLVEINKKKNAFLQYVNALFNLKCTIADDFLQSGEKNNRRRNILTTRGVRLTPQIIEQIKIKNRYLIHFTSLGNKLPLSLIEEVELNSISAKLYLL